MTIPTPSEVTSLLVECIRPHVTFKDHESEIAVMFAIRDAVQADRDQHAKHIAAMASSLLPQPTVPTFTDAGRARSPLIHTGTTAPVIF